MFRMIPQLGIDLSAVQIAFGAVLFVFWLVFTTMALFGLGLIISPEYTLKKVYGDIPNRNIPFHTWRFFGVFALLIGSIPTVGVIWRVFLF